LTCPSQRESQPEFLGTFWLVRRRVAARSCRSFPGLGIGFAGVAVAFGLALLTAAYAIGRISGCHINPAVSVGLWTSGRFKPDLLPYVVAQVLGAIVAGGVTYVVASGSGIRRQHWFRGQRFRRPFTGWLHARLRFLQSVRRPSSCS
jgi:glycerol uptake facilitator-like aquaporin